MGILSILMESIDGGIGPTEGGAAAAAAETFPVLVMAFFDLWLAVSLFQEMATVLFDASVLCSKNNRWNWPIESTIRFYSVIVH